MDNDKDKRLMEQYQKGNSAQKAFNYFTDWMVKERATLIRKMTETPDKEVAISYWSKLRLIDEFEKNIMTDIQSGELAMLESETEY